jgi:ketosteroid isomerase-like protein
LSSRYDQTTSKTLETIQQFNAAFNRRDVNQIMALMTNDCVFENTSPAPDGERYQGVAAVRAFWEQFFAASPQAVFDFYDVFAVEDRGVVRWSYRWSDDQPGQPGHVFGVDILRVRDAKIAEKLSYVKG